MVSPVKLSMVARSIVRCEATVPPPSPSYSAIDTRSSRRSSRSRRVKMSDLATCENSRCCHTCSTSVASRSSTVTASIAST